MVPLRNPLSPRARERLRACLIGAVVTLLLAAALTLTAVRLLVAAAPGLGGDAEALLSGLLGQEVTIGALDARLDGLRPSLLLEEVTIATEHGPSRIRSLAVTVAPWTSLASGELRLHRVRLRGAAITLARTADGRFELRGLPPPQAEVPPRRIELDGIRVRLVDEQGGGRLQLAPVALRFERDAGGLRIGVDARRAGAPGERLRASFHASSAGRPASGRGHLELDGLGLAALQPWLPEAVPAPGAAARLDGRLWLQVEDGRPAALQGRLTAAGLASAGAGVEAVAGELAWQRRPGGWELALGRLTVRDGEGGERALGPLRLAREQRAGERRWRLSAAAVDIGLARDLAQAAALVPARWAERLETLAPRGRLRDVKLVQGGDDWHLAATLSGVSIEPADGWPGASRVSGRLEAGPGGGDLQLQARAGALRLPWLFRGPLPYDRLAGQLAWYLPEDGVPRFRAAGLEAAIGEARLAGEGTVWLDPEGGPFLDIRARVRHGDASHTPRYLPSGIMPEGLVRWLDGAITAGRVPEADLMLFGAARDFPYGDGSGTFRVTGRAEDTRFAFHPDWPPLEAVSGEFEFRNRAMRIRAQGGRIQGAGIARASAVIEDLRDPRLRVDGTVRSPGSALLRFLAESPLLRDPSRLERLRLEGDTVLDLGLELPFDGRPPAVEGRIDLTGTRLTLADAPLRVEDLRGEIRFDEHGMAWDGLVGRYAGEQVMSRARTTGEGAAARIQVDAVATLSAADLPGGDALSALLEGRSEWLMRMQRPGFRAPPGPTRLSIESALRGTAVQAPLGLGKAADAARPSRLQVALGSDGEMRLELSYGERLRAAAVRPAGTERARVAVNLGERMPSPPQRPILVLGGRLPPVEARELAALAQTLPAAGRSDSLPPLGRADLELAAIDAGRWRLGETRLQARRRGDGWALDLDGAARGRVFVPPGLAPVSAELSVLSLERLEREAVPVRAAERDDEGIRVPRSFALQLEAASLRLAGGELGALELALEADGERIGEGTLRLAGEHLELEASGRRSSEGEGVRSRADLALDTDDAGALLAGLGLEGVLRRGSGTASAKLSWEGGLLQPAVDSLDGELSVELRDGALPAVEPGAGRAVGLFSLSLLPRRLALDFSDIVDSGLVFDRLDGCLRIDEGVMTAEPLSLDGPTARLRLRGSVDLAARTYDQWVTVTPRLSSTLPLIGGLAGGPAAAVILLLTQEIIEPGVNRFTRLHYRITGSWEEPRITPVSALPPDLGESDDD